MNRRPITVQPAERFCVMNPNHVVHALNNGQLPSVHYLIDSLPLLKQGYALRDSL